MSQIAELLEQQINAAVEKLAANYDPIEQVTLGQDLNQAMLDGQAAVAQLRRGAVRTLRMEGWKLKEIGDAAGMTHQRVSQIEAGADRKEKG